MLNQHIIDFNENLLGLREFVELIDPFLNEKITEHNKQVFPLFVSAYVENTLASKADDEWEEGEKDKFLKMRERLQEEIKNAFSIVPEVIMNNDADGGFTFNIKSSSDDVTNLIETANKTTKHIELLYTNSLISSLSSVEWFFSQILHFYYDKHPESAGVQKRTMTLADLKTFDSIKDAEKHLIDVKIEEILRGNFESWISLLKSELSLGLSYLDPLLDQLTEIYQRRNLFVHNGGVVNSIYLSKTKESLRAGVVNGQKLTVNKKYLDDSICKLQQAFILVGAELWKKLDPNDETRGDVLTDIIYENLLHSRWEICEGLCYFILKDSKLNIIDKIVAQLNYWLCQKELGKFDAVKKEIMETDFSDKKEIFQLGLFALQDKVEEFFEILPVALDSKQINVERLEEFPILKDIRETEQYKLFKQESKYFREGNQEIEKLDSVQKE